MAIVISGSNGISTNGTNWVGSFNKTNDVVQPTVPAFSVAGTQAAAQSSGQVAPFNYPTLNQGSYYNASTYRFTAPVAGIYLFSVHGIMGHTGGQANIYLRKNGSMVCQMHRNDSTATAWEQASVTAIMNLVVNDYVDVYIAVGSLYLDNGNFYSRFNGFLIG